MSGQIPSYGRHFRLERLPYTPDRANRAYIFKRDPAWFIRSDKASKVWRVYWMTPGTGASYSTATAIGTPLPTLGMAMNRLLEGMDRGFYQVTDARSTWHHAMDGHPDAQERALATPGFRALIEPRQPNVAQRNAYRWTILRTRTGETVHVGTAHDERHAMAQVHGYERHLLACPDAAPLP